MIETRLLTPAERARLAGAHRQAVDAAPRAAPSEIAERMADRMIDITALAGHCTDADLIEAGFTPHDLDRHAADARAMARTRWNRSAS
ncbi:hypothetical protein [Jiella pelagia]|uniref:DUF1127 domain-containing protein n=1 Tax=Jiella pelagia TaxID=2986949 RepID=A0ABY7BTY4_9HYPH|nr:hypothetical protein [Jiella pelagia]WAP67207.1 hypothetical protein OH818_16655 [Jiella pelagia]